MTYSVERLTQSSEAEFSDFVAAMPSALIYLTLRYRDLLRDFLKAEDHYFVARDSARTIVGVFPAFIKHVPGNGSVANSLPFYGSNGGPLMHVQHERAGQLMLQHFEAYAADLGCLSSTVVFSPLSDAEGISQMLGAGATDSRIGQITYLPSADHAAAIAVMNFLDSKTRNMVRKAEKLGIAIDRDESVIALQFLSNTHAENMAEIGGQAKPLIFFELLQKNFRSGLDYRIYNASLDGVRIASLLLLYCNNTVEYFTPVIVKEYRSTQAMSLLIFKAMTDAVHNGLKVWNWGGTWHSQTGVHKFKKSWGATDMLYYYSTRLRDPSLLLKTKEELTRAYPYFYVMPFEWLRS